MVEFTRQAYILLLVGQTFVCWGIFEILNLWRPIYNTTTDGRYVNVKLALFFIIVGMVLNIAATS